MKRAGLFAAVVAVALTAWVWTDRTGRAARADRQQPAVVPVAEPAAATEPAAPEPEAPEETAPASGPVAVRGRVVLLGTDRAPRSVSGAFLTDGGIVKFLATDGRFTVDLIPGRYHVANVVIDGEEIKRFHQEVVIDSRGEVEVRIPDVHEVTLVVVDARERKPIPDALVYEDRDGRWDRQEGGDRIPSPEQLKGEARSTDAKGRLPLGSGRGSLRICLHAEGYAWRHEEIPFDVGGEVMVELNRGGDLRLLIPRFAELKLPQIWARRAFTGEWDLFQPPLAGAEEILVEGLAADEYEVRICRGKWFEDGKLYGTATGSVRAGGISTITIAVTPDPALVMVKVTGTLTTPDGWNDRPQWISFKGVEESNAEVRETVTLGDRRRAADGGPRDPLRFETKELPAGRYLVEVGPYQWVEWFTASDRNSHVDLRLPQPVTIRLRVVDAQQKDIGALAFVTWHVPLEGRKGWGSSGVDRTGEVFEFQVPAGAVAIGASAPGFLDAEETLEARKDRDLTLALGRAAIVVVRLRIDGKPFDGAGAKVEASGTNLWVGGSFEAGAATFDQLPAGNYRITLKDVPGCEATKPIDVEAAAGETRDVWFDLARKR